jgi:hypothetical protein
MEGKHIGDKGLMLRPNWPFHEFLAEDVEQTENVQCLELQQQSHGMPLTIYTTGPTQARFGKAGLHQNAAAIDSTLTRLYLGTRHYQKIPRLSFSCHLAAQVSVPHHFDLSETTRRSTKIDKPVGGNPI